MEFATYVNRAIKRDHGHARGSAQTTDNAAKPQTTREAPHYLVRTRIPSSRI
jgi:hypothetical protein